MDSYRKLKWEDLGIREKITYITAIIAFIAGFGLVIAAFVVPPLGQVHNSVLFVLGESLVYVAGVFSITTYLTSSAKGLKDRLEYRLDDIEKAQLERERLRYSDNIDDVPYEK